MMSTIERQNEIFKLVRESGKVFVCDLVNKFEVSAVAIRADLNKLNSKGLLVREHGGAIASNKIVKELPIKQKHYKNHDVKRRLALIASTLINDGDSIILDSGTTTEEIAIALSNHNNLTVMTNGLNVATKLSHIENINIMVTGGKLRQKSLSFFDGKAENSLLNYHFDKVILAVDGFDIKTGLSTHFSQEASINRIMCSISSEIIVVTDSTKFGQRGCHIICSMDEITSLVTDQGIPEIYKQALKKSGVKLHIVD